VEKAPKSTAPNIDKVRKVELLLFSSELLVEKISCAK
jgi:hypothetical protein